VPEYLVTPLELFGPEYVKINTMWEREERTGIITPGIWATAEITYLKDLLWRWSEKVNGMNLRLHFNGTRLTIGGRTDDAMLPAPLVAWIGEHLGAPELWRETFRTGMGPADVTVYGEGYGAGVHGGGKYRPDLAVIVFDVLVVSETGRWWLQPDDVADVAAKLGLETAPDLGTMTLPEAWSVIQEGRLDSAWPGVRAEGMVGRPLVPLFTRKGELVMVKIKQDDWAAYQRRDENTARVEARIAARAARKAAASTS
jgi:hypothetical protein